MNARYWILPGLLLAAAGGRTDEPATILSRTEAPDGSGGFRRTTLLVDEGARYPVRRVVEIHQPDTATGRPVLAKRSRMVGDHVIVKLAPGANRRDLERLAARAGASIRRRLHAPGLYLLAADAADLDTVPRLMAACAADPAVAAYAEPDAIGELDDTIPNDPYFANGSLWGHEKIQCPAAWDISTGTGGMVVAVIDTGIAYGHPDLAANMWRNPGENGVDASGIGMATNGADDDGNGFVDDVYGWDFYNDDHDPMDGNSHGTRCAGHIGAVGNNATGVVGVCWNVKLMAIKLFSDAGEALLSDMLDAFTYVAMMRERGINVRITSNSWGEEDYAQSLYDAVREHRDAGILCVTSAGNGSRSMDLYPQYPASFDLDNVIVAAATTETDGLRSSSNYGVTNVDLGAPGQNIWSTGLNGGYASSSGTSRSAPFTAGAAALLWDVLPPLAYGEVRQAVLEGVDPTASLRGKTVTGGRLNVYRALRRIRPFIAHTPLVNTTNTSDPHGLSATLLPRPLLASNRQWVCWNTNGSTDIFVTNSMTRGPDDTYHAAVPAQPLGARVHYFLQAETDAGLVRTDPALAPQALHVFDIVEPALLTITGRPVQAAAVLPGYGSALYPSGIVVSVSAPAHSSPVAGTRYAADGWTGWGSVPAAGASNAFSFTLRAPSTCEWAWAAEYSLTQSSTVPGIVQTASWWRTAVTGRTVTAVSSVRQDMTNYAFAEWSVDGVRQPDASNRAANPAAVVMQAPRAATARYLPEDQDSDDDGLPDYWELFYFGNLTPVWTNDSDADGMADGGELRAGTDPVDGADALRVVSLHAVAGGADVVIRWPGVSNRLYRLSERPDLLTGDWNEVVGNIPAVVPFNAVTAQVQRVRPTFYRIGVAP